MIGVSKNNASLSFLRANYKFGGTHMAPSAWSTNPDITALKALEKGGGMFSRWPAIRDAVVEYEGLRDDDLNGRRATLTKIEAAIQTWTKNQASVTTVVRYKDLVDDKRAALASLQALILIERQELAPRPAVPLVPVITRTAPAPTSTATAPMLTMSASTSTTASLSASSASTSTTSASRSAAPVPFATTRAIPISRAIPFRSGVSTQGATQQDDSMHPSDFSESFAHSWENPVIQNIGGVWQNQAGEQLLGEGSVAIDGAQLKAFQQSFGVYVHFTKKAYEPGVFHDGLVPGKKQGIGLANDEDPSVRGKPDTENVYVVSGSVPKTTGFVSGDAGGRMIVVVSLRDPASRDVNYKGGAHYFIGSVPPVRDAAGSDKQTFSFTLPMGQRTAEGLCNLLNTRINPQVNVDQAAALLLRELNNKFPLYLMGAGTR
jgi:hypothetical protein